MLHASYRVADLKLSDVFEVSSNARTTTEVIGVEIRFGDLCGFGQASFPPYMAEKREANMFFLQQLHLENFNSPFQLEDIHKHMDSVSAERRPAKAAVDMALHDLMGKVAGLPLNKLLGLETREKLFTSFTIGIGKDDFILQQLGKARDFGFLKIKLGGDVSYNKHVISLIREQSSQPLGVDFNQGMPDKDEAMHMIEWLSARQVEYVEQPLPVKLEEAYIWLKSRSPLEIFGDESIQVAADVVRSRDLFHGVNIKLMKCGGVRKAYEMVRLARTLGLKTMLGCMVESVCAITAAAHLGVLFDRLDLDGHLNIASDPFSGITIHKSELAMPETPGLGVSRV